MLRITALWLAFTGMLLASLSAGADDSKADARKQAIQKELEKFVGTWEIVTKGVSGKATKIEFKKDRTYSTYDDKGKLLWSGTFDIDPTAKPKIWDHREKGEPQKSGRDILGIYEFDGDRLKTCVVQGKWQDGKWVGPPRPTEFKTVGFKEAKKQGKHTSTVIEFRRIKK